MPIRHQHGQYNRRCTGHEALVEYVWRSCGDEIIIHRLWIGHTFLTHEHLLKKESPPQCSACQTQLAVEHVVLHCLTWNAICANHFTGTNLLDLFSKVTPCCIVDFIKEIGLYRRIWSTKSFYVYRFYPLCNFLFTALIQLTNSHTMPTMFYFFLQFVVYYNPLFLD